MAIAELADEATSRSQRNLALDIGGLHLEPAPWLSALAKIAGRIGLDVGAVALRSKLGYLGITGELLGLVEDELKNESGRHLAGIGEWKSHG